MQIDFGSETLATTLEGSLQSVSDGRDVDSLPPTRAESGAIARAVATPPNVSVNAKRSCSDWASAFDRLIAPASLDDGGNLLLTAADKSSLALANACLSSATSTLTGLRVATFYSFIGDEVYTSEISTGLNCFESYVISTDVELDESLYFGGALAVSGEVWDLTSTSEYDQTITIEDCSLTFSDSETCIALEGYGGWYVDDVYTVLMWDSVTLTIDNATITAGALYADYYENDTKITIEDSTFGNSDSSYGGSIYLAGKCTLTVDNSEIICGSGAGFANYCTSGSVTFKNGSTYAPEYCYPIENSSATDVTFSIESGAVITAATWYANCYSGSGNEVIITGDGSKLIVTGYVYPIPSSTSGSANYCTIENGALFEMDSADDQMPGWWMTEYGASNVNRIRLGGGYIAFRGDVRGTSYEKIGYMLACIGTVVTDSDGNELGTATTTCVQVRGEDGSWADANDGDLTITYCETEAECLAATGNLYALAGYTIVTGGYES